MKPQTNLDAPSDVLFTEIVESPRPGA
jgi:hypothetical protein